MLILTSFPQTENYLELALDRFIEVYVLEDYPGTYSMYRLVCMV